MAVIELSKLSKWYGEVIGLNNVTAVIEHGITGLVGPNGAGKSTMMGLIMGQLHPSKGSIRVFGCDVWDKPAVLSQIGFCPEGDPFWSNLTGRQFVVLLAKMSGLHGAVGRQAVQEAIKRVGMAQQADRSINGYSKGMRQRIKIAQAIVHKPKLLILDEPLTGADPVGRHDLTNLFAEMSVQGVDVLVSSHVLHEVEALTKQILMIDRGRIVAHGEIANVRRTLHDRPHSIRVRLDEPRRLAGRLAEMDVVTGLQIKTPDTLVIETMAPGQVYDRLSDLLLTDAAAVYEIASADDSLEAVFGYLTDRGQGSGR